MSESGNVFDIERIRELIELMEQHDLREIELRQGEEQIKLNRGFQSPAVAPLQTAPAPVQQAPPQAAPAEEDDGNFHYIECPMVGTFYSKPNPESPSFVKVGDHVNAETTICIVEAMKVFNEIAAECTGTVAAILVGNEEPVDVGKKLFKIDTSG